MRKAIRNKRRDRRFFGKTARRTKKINQNVSYRGGIRL